MSSKWWHLKAWSTKPASDPNLVHQQDFVTATDNADGTKRGVDVNLIGDSSGTLSPSVDSQNSTSTPLNNAAVFTGAWVERTSPEMIVAVASDQDCQFQMQFSVNASDIDSTLTYTYDASGINVPKRLVIARRYYRVVVTNNSGFNMTYLRAQTSTGTFAPLASRLNASLAVDADAEVVRSVIAGLSPSGSYLNVGVNEAGAVDTTDFLFDVSRGRFSAFSIDTKFGNNPDIDTASTPEDIWEGGGLYTGQPIHSAAAETVTIVSDSGNDTAAGTGARTVRIFGLDANFDEQQEDLTMNGTTLVTSSGSYKRVFRAFVLTAGSAANNVGILTIAHSTTTANIFARIPAGRGQTAIAAYTVPNNKTMNLVRFRASIGRSSGAAGQAIFTVRARQEGGVYRAVRSEAITTNFPVEYTTKGSIVFPEKTDIIIRCESVSDNNTAFASAFEYVLVDD